MPTVADKPCDKELLEIEPARDQICANRDLEMKLLGNIVFCTTKVEWPERRAVPVTGRENA